MLETNYVMRPEAFLQLKEEEIDWVNYRAFMLACSLLHAEDVKKARKRKG